MDIIPYANVIYRSDLSVEEIIKRLNEITEPYKPFNLKHAFSKPFEGEISDQSFSIRRILDNRFLKWNRPGIFKPILKGKIRKGIFGTTIHVTMKLDMFPSIFLGAFIVLLVSL